MKSQVELFVGNIPVGTTQQGLVDFLNAAMLKVRVRLVGAALFVPSLLRVVFFVLLLLVVWFLSVIAALLLLVLLP